MIHYRKRSFARAHRLLNELRSNLSALPKLRELQLLLFREIRRAELKIRAIKHELRNNNINAIGDSRTGAAHLERRLEGVRQCAYIFRCFGDAIAFLYMDKHALKHTFYNTHNMSAKQSAGFILDKDGLAHEISVLETLLENGVPALLTDLTNTIRHGDICIMTALDPQLVEVKSSKKLDTRGKKQKRNLRIISSFFETDKTTELRGVGTLLRTNYDSPERAYADEMNSCVSDALRLGLASRHPERGLYYIAATRKTANLQQVLEGFDLNSPWVFFLNEHKLERTWMPYFPFTLSITGWDELWSFILGRVSLFVFIEPKSLCEAANDLGCANARFETDRESPTLFIDPPGVDGGAYISIFPIRRIGFEFLSPKWVIQSSIEAITRGCQSAQAASGGRKF